MRSQLSKSKILNKDAQGHLNRKFKKILEIEVYSPNFANY